MTLYVVPRRLTHRGRYAVVVGTAALAVVALFVVTQLSSPPSADAGQKPTTTEDGVDAELAARFAAAQDAASKDGVVLTITSGRRSVAEQQRLVDEAVTKHGSAQEAHRWVLPPESSPHVQGLALDVGPTAGALWLGQHGVEFGLCRTYANEVWHFEKLPDGLTQCPQMHPDSSWGW
ncbi:M15 family metallopeptidase [Cellulomonas sp. URHD0024]|uniref:M15 family metallopeptidase n=1 Tax=Cellulomonas sp. URHD0024 TaxID=1302620 RepID=UPI000481E8A9|nr:M15 family metallopeptidase [Cellulomonas sp. URHD0024]